MWHLGIDLHRRTVVVAAVRDSGETIEPRTFDWQRPVICYRFIGESGRMEYHSLIIDDDSWVRVKPRKKTT